MAKSNILDIEGEVLKKTELAVRFSTTGRWADAVWLPLSVVEVDESCRPAVITLPKWLALEKGLI